MGKATSFRFSPAKAHFTRSQANKLPQPPKQYLKPGVQRNPLKQPEKLKRPTPGKQDHTPSQRKQIAVALIKAAYPESEKKLTVDIARQTPGGDDLLLIIYSNAKSFNLAFTWPELVAYATGNAATLPKPPSNAKKAADLLRNWAHPNTQRQAFLRTYFK